MLKLYILIIINLLVSISLYCQVYDLEVVSKKEVPIGINRKNQTKIIGKEIGFPANINNIYFDTSTSRLSIHLRGTSPNGKWLENNGYFFVFNPIKDSILWSKKILYSSKSYYSNNIVQADSLIIIGKNKGYFYKGESSIPKWKIKKSIIKEIFPKMNIAVALGSSGPYGDPEIQGIELDNGELIWRKTIASYNGWEQLYQINDSCILVLSNGLHMINIKNGNGWHTRFKIENNIDNNQYLKTAAKVTIGTYTGVFPSNEPQKINEDKLIIDSSNIFYLANDFVYCLSKTDGVILWNQKLSNNGYGFKDILHDQKTIYILTKNKLHENRIIALNKNNGESKYSHISIKQPIIDYSLLANNLLVISQNQIILIDKKSGIVINSLTIDPLKSGMLKMMANVSFLYAIADDNRFVKIKNKYPSSIAIATTKNLLLFDDKLTLLESLELTNLSYTLSKSNNFELIKRINNDEFWLLNEDKGTLLQSNFGKNAILKNNILYGWNKTNLFIFDLKTLSEE